MKTDKQVIKELKEKLAQCDKAFKHNVKYCLKLTKENDALNELVSELYENIAKERYYKGFKA